MYNLSTIFPYLAQYYTDVQNARMRPTNNRASNGEADLAISVISAHYFRMYNYVIQQGRESVDIRAKRGHNIKPIEPAEAYLF